jgi:hypothetical protein
LVALAGVLNVFRQAEDLLERMSGLKVSREGVRTLTEEEGKRLETLHPANPVVEPRKATPWDFSLPDREGKSFEQTVAYLGLDAFAVPTRNEQGGRDWKMLYVGLLYTPDKEHTLYLTGYDRDRLIDQMRAYAIGFQLGKADRIVALTDGANGLENALQSHFGGKVECILDFWHVCEHVHGYARLCYGEESEEAKNWSESIIERLRQQGGESGLAWMEKQPFGEKSSSEVVLAWERLKGYLRNNGHRMDYPKYRKEGLDIGSGPTEAGCKIVGQRLRGSGMKWEQGHSSQVASLRALYLSGEGLWDAFFYPSGTLAA